MDIIGILVRWVALPGVLHNSPFIMKIGMVVVARRQNGPFGLSLSAALWPGNVKYIMCL
jgi:hypothetical protein